jgi:hypothetical protein
VTTYLQRIQGVQRAMPWWGYPEIREWIFQEYGADLGAMTRDQLDTEIPGTPLTEDPRPRWGGPPMAIPQPTGWTDIPQTQYTPEDIASLRGRMEGPEVEEFVVSPEESARVLAEGVEEPRWPQPPDPDAAARAQALRVEREAASAELRPEESFEFQHKPGTTTPAAYREMLREPGRQLEQWQRTGDEESAAELAQIHTRQKSEVVPAWQLRQDQIKRKQLLGDDPRSWEPEVGPRGTLEWTSAEGKKYIHDPSVRQGLAYARGEDVPPEGMTARETVLAQAGTGTVPSDTQDDFLGWQGTVAGRLVWTPVGVGEAGGEFFAQARLTKQDIYSYEVHRKAEHAKADGRVFIDVETPEGKEVRYNVDDIILTDEKQAEMRARINSRGALLKEQLAEQRSHLNQLLEDDPDWVSWYTAELWRNNVGDLIRGLGQFVVYGSGAYPMSAEESGARGFVDNFFAAEKASKFWGATMATGLVASYANLMTNTEQKIQAEGPTVILDALMFYSMLKAGALKSGLTLPQGVVEIGTKLEKIGAPLVERIKSSKPADWYNTAQRNLVDSSANINRHGAELTNELQKNSVNQQRAIDNYIQNKIIPMVEGGDVRLAPKEGPVTVVRDVPTGRVGTRGETQARPVGILPEEAELFEATRDARFRERMRERDYSRDVGAEGGTVQVPSGLTKKGEWRYSKNPTEYTLTGEQLAVWEDALADGLIALRKARRAKGRPGAKFGKKISELERELGAIAAGKRNRPTAPAEIEAAELAAATKDAAQTVAERRSPWGRRGDETVPIETMRHTETIEVKLVESGVPVAEAKAPLTSAGEQYLIEEISQRATPRTTAEISEEVARVGRVGPFKGPKRAGDPGEYIITPRLQLTDAAEKVFKELGDTVAGGGEASVRFVEDLKANVARSLDDSLPELLRSKKFRQEVAQDVANITVNRMEDEARFMSGRQRKTLVESIERQIEEKQARSTPESGAPGGFAPLNVLFKIRDEAGKVVAEVNLFDEVSKRVLNDPEVRTRVMAESVMQTGRRAGIRRAQKHAQQTFVSEMDKGVDPRWMSYNARGASVPTQHSEFLRAVHTYLETDSLPAVLSARPNQLIADASNIRNGGTVAHPSHKKGFGLEQLRRIMGREGIEVSTATLARRLRDIELRLNRFDDFASDKYSAARRFVRVGDDLYEKAQAQRTALGGERFADPRRQVEIEPRPLHRRVAGGLRKGDETISSVYVNRQTAKALDNFSLAKEAVEVADNWLHGNAIAKSSLTAAQLTTMKNNVLSNYFLQALRRGSPLHPGHVMKAVYDYKKWQKDPGSVSARDARVFDALSRTGKIETSVVDAEIAAHQHGGGINWLWRKGYITGDMARVLNGVVAPRKLMEKGYRFTDEAMKVEEGRWGFNIMERDLDRLAAGRMLELEVGYGKRVTLKKVSKGRFDVGTGRGRRFKKTGTIEAGTKLDDIIARASMRSGDKLFFDYFDVPDLPRKLRTSKWAALVSPFYTWLNKSMDVPGFKKGLLHEVLSGGPHMWTDDAAIQMGITKRAAQASATAHMALQAQSQSPYTKDEAALLQKTMGWGSNPLVALGPVAEGVISTYNLSSSNPFQGADLIFQAAQQAPILASDAINKLMGFVGSPLEEFGDQRELIEAYRLDPGGVLNYDLEGETGERKKEIRARRKWLIEKGMGKKGITLGDWLDVIGFAGHPILEIWHMSEEAEKRGRRVSMGNRAQRLAALVFGGTYVKAADALVGAVKPESPLTTRFDRADPVAGEDEALLKWAIRSITGIGWTKRNFKKRDKRYFRAVKETWHKSLIEPLNERLKTDRKIVDSAINYTLSEEAKERIRNVKRMKKDIENIIKYEVRELQREHQKIEDERLDAEAERERAKEEKARGIERVRGRASQ